ncbi:MAG: ABC transporter ATP-binding protein [Anaerolineales bacterium]
MSNSWKSSFLSKEFYAMIKVVHITKRFANTIAVNDISLQVKAGEIYGLVGPDGAGKTTAMRLICGALHLDSGSITIGEYDIQRQTDLARSLIGYLAQRFSLYEDLTVLENIRFFAEVRGLSSTEWLPRSLDILQFVGLLEFKDRFAGKLSGGMKQKLGLAAALVHQPRILLLDEPTTGVDPVTRQDFWQLIIKLATKEGVAILVSTPYMDEASRCHRVGFMRAGKILLEDSPQALQNTLKNRILELKGSPLSLLKSLAAQNPLVQDAQMFGDRIHIRIVAGQPQAVMDNLSQTIQSHGGVIQSLRVIEPQLEDVFISLIETNHE